MLVLSREKEEEIVIGEDGAIVIKIVGIYGGKVRLGITAPKSIPVHRREIYDAIKKEKTEAEERHAKEELARLQRLISQPPIEGLGMRGTH